MKKNLRLLVVAFVCIAQALYAQDMTGFHSSNYAGVYNLQYNPAEIVGNPYKFDMNLIGYNVNAANDFVYIKRKDLFKDLGGNWRDQHTGEKVNGNAKNAYANLGLNGPLSFMFTVKKSAFALSYGVHSMVNLDNLNEDAARGIYRELEDSTYWRREFNSKNFNLQTSTYADFGISYGREILNTGNHYLKAAGTLKYLMGMGSFYMYSKSLDLNFKNSDSLYTVNGDISYGSSGFYSNGGDTTSVWANLKSFNKPSFAVDLGAVYEFRPASERKTYEMDCKTDNIHKDLPQYKFKVGFALTDFGAIKYKRSANNYNIKSNGSTDIPIKAFENITDGTEAIDSILYTKFTVDTFGTGSTYTMWLPTRLNIYGDYHIWKGLYVNASASINVVPKTREVKLHHISNYVITPRFENRYLGISLPVSVNGYGKVNVGTGLRLGPVTLGTNDVLGWTGLKQKVYNANFYAAVHISILNKKPKDSDKDKISNKKDKCKKIAGDCTNMGCPNLDKDGDGILDADDKCPEIAGVKELAGCPDKDKDGITDAEDKCPEVAGIAEFQGCPDTDKDGITDAEDKCPTVAGLKEFQGCPDTDKDGITDADDKCPTVAGPKENNGCPYPDTDGDGVLDKDDECPKTAGLAENKGCPKVEQKEQKVLDLAFQNLEFETGKDVIRKTSYPSLTNLGSLLVSKPSYKLTIDGHTDNVGDAAKNQILSEKRAAAVKAFLVSKGVKDAQLITAGHGATMPIADNKTAAGRQKNRRVEMKVKFD